jgi:hypothetical protein
MDSNLQLEVPGVQDLVCHPVVNHQRYTQESPKQPMHHRITQLEWVNVFLIVYYNEQIMSSPRWPHVKLVTRGSLHGDITIPKNTHSESTLF